MFVVVFARRCAFAYKRAFLFLRTGGYWSSAFILLTLRVTLLVVRIPLVDWLIRTQIHVDIQSSAKSTYGLQLFTSALRTPSTELESTTRGGGMSKHATAASEKLIPTENFTPSQCDFKVMHTKAYSCTSRCKVSRGNLLGLVCSEELLEEMQTSLERSFVILRWRRFAERFSIFLFYFFDFCFPNFHRQCRDLTPKIDRRRYFPTRVAWGYRTQAHITVLAAWDRYNQSFWSPSQQSHQSPHMQAQAMPGLVTSHRSHSRGVRDLYRADILYI